MYKHYWRSRLIKYRRDRGRYACGKRATNCTYSPPCLNPGSSRRRSAGAISTKRPYLRRIAEANPNIVPLFVPPRQGPILEPIAEQIRVGGAPTGGILNGPFDDGHSGRSAFGRTQCLAQRRDGQPYMRYYGWSLLPGLLLTGRWWRLLDEIRSSGYRWRHMLHHLTIAAFARIFVRLSWSPG
jgi:hypothetical protein